MNFSSKLIIFISSYNNFLELSHFAYLVRVSALTCISFVEISNNQIHLNNLSNLSNKSLKVIWIYILYFLTFYLDKFKKIFINIINDFFLLF